MLRSHQTVKGGPNSASMTATAPPPSPISPNAPEYAFYRSEELYCAALVFSVPCLAPRSRAKTNHVKGQGNLTVSRHGFSTLGSTSSERPTMVVLMTAAALFGVLLGRFFTAFILAPACCLVFLLALAGSPLSVMDSTLRIIALMVSLQFGYVTGLASTDMAAIRKRWRRAPRNEVRTPPSLSPRSSTQRSTIAASDAPHGRR